MLRADTNRKRLRGICHRFARSRLQPAGRGKNNIIYIYKRVGHETKTKSVSLGSGTKAEEQRRFTTIRRLRRSQKNGKFFPSSLSLSLCPFLSAESPAATASAVPAVSSAPTRSALNERSAQDSRPYCSAAKFSRAPVAFRSVSTYPSFAFAVVGQSIVSTHRHRPTAGKR